MGTFALRHFSRPETLRTIATDRLINFLNPHRQFFSSRGLALPPTGSSEELDYSRLIGVFLSPNKKTPSELIDALYVVDEMATDEGMEALLDEVERQGLKILGSDHTPADVAVHVYLINKRILERIHAEHHVARVRSFESYQTDRSKKPRFRSPSAKQLEALASELDDWFEGRKRGRGARIWMVERADGVLFLVRHGELFKREESMDGIEPSSVCFRPLKYDVLFYSPHVGELLVNARSKGEKELYRAQFGKHLFGDADLFPGTEKYTLNPLREQGEASLTCSDIVGIDWVKLVEVQFLFGGDPYEVVTRKSGDMFSLLELRGKPFPEGGRIIRATFKIKFSDSKMPRSVVIKPSNIAQFTRDDDSVLVEEWLEARGFVVNGAPRECACSNGSGGPLSPCPALLP
jgi:hypothetical protein